MIRDLLDRPHRKLAMSKGEEMLAVRAGCAPLEPLAAGRGRRVLPAVVRLVADWLHRVAVVVGHDHEPALAEPSSMEKCTLSDPGRFGRETRCPRLCWGQGVLRPGPGSLRVLQPVRGLAPGRSECRSKLL